VSAQGALVCCDASADIRAVCVLSLILLSFCSLPSARLALPTLPAPAHPSEQPGWRRAHVEYLHYFSGGLQREADRVDCAIRRARAILLSVQSHAQVDEISIESALINQEKIRGLQARLSVINTGQAKEQEQEQENDMRDAEETMAQVRTRVQPADAWARLWRC
jgi:hypothetical protein